MKRLLLNSIAFVLISFLFLYPVFADNTDDISKQVADKQAEIQKLETQLADTRNQEKTLKSQLDLIDGQTKITALKIEETNLKIEKLKREIADLLNRIKRIGATLDSLSEILLQRIVQTYKYSNDVSTLNLLFSSHGLTELIERLKYIQVAQAYNKQKLYELQATKLAYNDQKQDKLTRQQEAEKLNNDLVSYKKQLDQQKKTKQELLTQTQGDEATYQKLLAQAQAQLAAFSSFVQSEGGVTLISADPNWPSGYFSQRDIRWGELFIGNSHISIGAAGCLVTSVAMTLTHRGNAQTPITIGSNDSYFFLGNFIWSGITSLGFNTPERTTDTSNIDKVLNAGKWAIVGISYTSNASSEPFHFVVITSKNGNDYNLFDPWKGPNISFNNNYSGKYITEIITY